MPTSTDPDAFADSIGLSARSTLRITGAIQNQDYLAGRLWGELDALRAETGARAALLAEIAALARDMEAACAQLGAAPGRMETPSRQVYCWLRWLAERGHLERHLDALYRGRAIARELGVEGDGALTLHLLHMGSLWRHKPRRQILQLHQAFVDADRAAWRAVFSSALIERTPAHGRAIRRFTSSTTFVEALQSLDAYAEAHELTRGRVYDLDASFSRINDRYFEGQIERPRLAWSRGMTKRKFGQYEEARDAITLSQSLDDPAVPRFVLDFVMYHELLHKKHGATLSPEGRRMSHTPAFKREERLFDRYEEAEARLRALARRRRALQG